MIFLRVLAVVLTLVSAAGALPSLGEYDVKAAFLLNFARYVEWPPYAFHSPGDPVLICVLGQDPFGQALDEVIAGKTIEGRDIAVRRITDIRGADACRVLFLGVGESKVPGMLPATGILTVGESDGRGSGDAVITFVIEDGRVHFTINLGAAGRENLRISSRLLGLASNVRK